MLGQGVGATCIFILHSSMTCQERTFLNVEVVVKLWNWHFSPFMGEEAKDPGRPLKG